MYSAGMWWYWKSPKMVVKVVATDMMEAVGREAEQRRVKTLLELDCLSPQGRPRDLLDYLVLKGSNVSISAPQSE